jgi:hypothetical protein
MSTEIISQKQTIFFPHAASVEPKDLITFHDDYLNHLFELKHYLKKNAGSTVTILLRRINSDESVAEKRITGVVTSIADDFFIFSAYHDLSSEYDYMHESTIRFDNVLGDIPLMAHAADMKMVEISKSLDSYRKSLAEMRVLLLTALDVEHAATLYFRHSNERDLFVKGDYRVDCEILKVNKSNALIKRFRSHAYIDKNNQYLDLAKYDEHVRFVSDCYLWKVDLCLGEKHSINMYDE